jgi:hypothetical protein
LDLYPVRVLEQGRWLEEDWFGRGVSGDDDETTSAAGLPPLRRKKRRGAAAGVRSQSQCVVLCLFCAALCLGRACFSGPDRHRRRSP